MKPTLFLAKLLLIVLIFLAAARSYALQTTPILDSQLHTAEDYLYQGDYYAGLQDFDTALKYYDQAIQLRLDYAEAYNNRGYACYWAYKCSHAISDFDRAIELRPNYSYAYNSRGAAYMASGDSGRAIADFDQAIALQPDFPQAYINRGNAYLRLGRLDLALSDFSHGGRPIGLLGLCFVPPLLVIAFFIYRRSARRRQRLIG